MTNKLEAEESMEVPELLPIYVASRASVPERGAMWRRFRDEGVAITSSWIDEDGEGDTEDFGNLWERIVSEIRAASALVLYAEENDFPLKGAYIEAGIALALNMPVVICLPGVALDLRSSRPIGSWVSHPLVTRNNIIENAIQDAQDRAARTNVSQAPTEELIQKLSEENQRLHAERESVNQVFNWFNLKVGAIQCVPTDLKSVVSAYDELIRLCKRAAEMTTKTSGRFTFHHWHGGQHVGIGFDTEECPLCPAIERVELLTSAAQGSERVAAEIRRQALEEAACALCSFCADEQWGNAMYINGWKHHNPKNETPFVPCQAGPVVALAYDEANLLTSEEAALVIGAIPLQSLPLAASPSLSGEPEQGWMPIETAPKDGQPLLLGYFNAFGNWRTMRGQWISEQEIIETWEEPDDGGEGWYETSVELDEPPSCWRTCPTHWQLLPAPPVIDAITTEGEK